MEADKSDPARPRRDRKEAVFLAQAAEAFERLRALDPAKRAEPLAALDPVLRQEVVELLAASEPSSDDALSEMRIRARANAVPWSAARGPVPEEALPERIGGLRVLRRLGAGGMGVVYEAEQEAPRRRVAVKLVRAGLAMGERLRRFRLEAEALGRLKHPGIAQIHALGTCDLGHGEQPYFVMELVEGQPLLVHAREAKLDRRARLALVAEVCDAVQHAHERGVVHRDLKPDNVLVDGEGRAKVLDFGVARVRADDVPLTTIHTAQGQIVGTLTHMAPEQLAGDPDAVGPAADVYALGVIAFQLLTGRLPHEVAGMSLTAAIRHITEIDTPRLGTFERALRGDVETIVAKALEPDPALRYVSPAALASDLRRHLAHQPIEARPPSRSYRVAKFARRHPGLVGTFAALFLGLAGTLGFALVASEQRRASQAATIREAEANVGLRQALYRVETRNASAAAQAHGGVESLQEYVARWEPLLATDGGEGWPGPWEFRLFAGMAHEPHLAVQGPAVDCGSLHPDGKRLATAGEGRVFVRDVENGKVLQVFPPLEKPAIGDAMYDVAWDRTGTRIVAAHHGVGFFVWDLAREDPLWSFVPEGEEVASVEWGGQSNRVFTTVFSGKLRCHDPATGDVLWTKGSVVGHKAAWGISPDGSSIAVAVSKGGLAIHDEGGELERVRALGSDPHAIAWSPDGSRIASSDLEGGVEVFDAARGNSLVRFTAHDKRVHYMRWSPDGTLLATLGTDFSIALWDTRDWSEVRRLRAVNGLKDWVCWSADGRTLVGGWSDTLRIWPIAGPTARRRGWLGLGKMNEASAIALHPDGVRVLTAQAYLVESWRLDQALPRGGHSNLAAQTASWNATGDRVALFRHNEILVAAADLIVLASFTPPRAYLTTCAWHPTDPRRLAIGGSQSLTVVDIDRPADEVQWHERPLDICCLAWTADGSALLADGPRRFEPETCSTEKQLGTGGFSRSIALSPDGRRFALGLDAQDVLIFETESFELKARLRGHSNAVWGLAWHPFEPRLASAGRDGKVILWDTERYELVATLEPGGPLGSVRWSHDGQRLISLTMTGLISVWDAGLRRTDDP